MVRKKTDVQLIHSLSAVEVLSGVAILYKNYISCRIIFYGNYLWNEKNVLTLHRIS